MASILFLLFLVGIYFFMREGVEAIDAPQSEGQESSSIDFCEAVMVLIAHVMLADGKMTKSELAEVKSYLANNYSENDAKNMLHYLGDYLKHVESMPDMRPFFLRINQYMEYKQRLTLLNTLFKVAVVDSRIEHSEADLIEMFARFACITQVDFNRLRGYYAYGFTWENTGKQQSEYQRNQQQSQPDNKNGLDKKWAYKVLGLEEGASEKEIKAAYRELSKQYHPDRQINASEEELKNTTEKFQQINEAYEMLMEKK